MIKELTTEIERLKLDLIATRDKSGIIISNERWGRGAGSGGFGFMLRVSMIKRGAVCDCDSSGGGTSTSLEPFRVSTPTSPP